MEQPKRTDSRVNLVKYRDGLQIRFDRLRSILFDWEQEAKNMPRNVLRLFDAEDLTGIQALMEEQRMLNARIQGLKQFIAKWDTPVSGFMEVARFRDE